MNSEYMYYFFATIYTEIPMGGEPRVNRMADRISRLSLLMMLLTIGVIEGGIVN